MPHTYMKSDRICIRLSPRLARRLQCAALRRSRGENWIIAQALETYLSKAGNDDLTTEARRQSLLASRPRRQRTTTWESDTAGWK